MVSRSSHLRFCLPCRLQVLPLESHAKVNSFFHRLLLIIVLYHGNRNITDKASLQPVLAIFYSKLRL